MNVMGCTGTCGKAAGKDSGLRTHLVAWPENVVRDMAMITWGNNRQRLHNNPVSALNNTVVTAWNCAHAATVYRVVVIAQCMRIPRRS